MTMSDPVDTDALRNPPWSNLDAVGALLDAAADEVDRLRAVIEDAPHETGSYCEEDAPADTRLCTCRKGQEDIDRLRAFVENAPHADECAWWNTDPPAPCTCWKADAL